jgi:hypothetical protein
MIAIPNTAVNADEAGAGCFGVLRLNQRSFVGD